MNIGEDGPSMIWGIVMVMLLIASLAARRLPLGQVAKMALVWVAIFAGLFVIFSFRPEITTVWNRVKADFAGTANQSVSSETVILTRRDDGHFWARVKINGSDVDFMVDSGATMTAVSSDVAIEAGIEIDDSGYPVVISTANGRIMAKRGSAASVELGPIKLTDHAMTVSDNLGETNLLGMNFLDSLSGWTVEKDVMTLRP